MKQHITLAQIEELPFEHLVIVQEWASKYDKQLYPLLTIGEMIEFLDERYDYFNTAYPNVDDDKAVRFRTIMWRYDQGLCDLLWESVKSALIG